MLEQDIPGTMPIPLALRRVADFLDQYGLSVGVDTDYHAGPGDTDLTDFAVYAPTPAGEFMQGSIITAHVDTSEKHLLFYRLRNFRGKPLKKKLSITDFRKHTVQMGARLVTYGQTPDRLAEYYHLLTTWDKRLHSHAALADILAVMQLPLEVFDKRTILAHASHLIPEMVACGHVPGSYLETLFGLEALREQDVIYRSHKRHGRLRPNA